MDKTEAQVMARKINQQERRWQAEPRGGYGPTAYGVEVLHRPSGERHLVYRWHEWEQVKRNTVD